MTEEEKITALASFAKEVIETVEETSEVDYNAALDAVLLLMIEQHEGKPCPTRKDIREWTGMPRRKIWAYLANMQERGLIEVEANSDTPGDPVRRRLRVAGANWTDWTARSGDANAKVRRPIIEKDCVMNIDKDALAKNVEELAASRERVRALQRAEGEHQREIYKRLRASQFDTKAIRIVLNRREMDPSKRDEQDYYVQAYELALGGKKDALDALEQGASIREAAKAGGISTGAAATLAKGVQ